MIWVPLTHFDDVNIPRGNEPSSSCSLHWATTPETVGTECGLFMGLAGVLPREVMRGRPGSMRVRGQQNVFATDLKCKKLRTVLHPGKTEIQFIQLPVAFVPLVIKMTSQVTNYP